MPKTRHDREYIAVGLPLPINIVATLGDLIDKAWPGAQIITNAEGAGVPIDVRNRWPVRDFMLIAVPKRAPKRVSKKDAAAAAAANDLEPGEEAADLTGLDDEWVTIAPPEELGAFLGAAGRHMLAAFEDATNYVEWEVIDRETGERTVLSVARSKGQTPGALRVKAEEQLAALRARVTAKTTPAAEEVPYVIVKHAVEETNRALGFDRTGTHLRDVG